MQALEGGMEQTSVHFVLLTSFHSVEKIIERYGLGKWEGDRDNVE